MRIPVGDNTAYIFKLTPHTTMKDKLASYNHLIETFVIVTETFLCGLLFLLFSKLSNEMQWDSLQVGGTTVSASHAYTDVMLRPFAPSIQE